MGGVHLSMVRYKAMLYATTFIIFSLSLKKIALMKKLFFCCLMAAAPALTYAQQDAKKLTPAENKAAFTLRVNQLDGALTANTDKKASNEMLMDVMGKMQQQISREMQEKETASPTQQKVLQNKIDAQQKLYGEVKHLTINAAGNHAEINSKLQAFTTTF